MIVVTNSSIDNTLWDITQKLCKRYTLTEAKRFLSPLSWYINTGRAPTGFLRLLVNASERQKSTIANRLVKSRTDEAAIDSVCQYLGWTRHRA